MIDPDTLIQVAPDCPVDRGTVPEGKMKDDPIYVIQYEVLSEHLYEFDQEGFQREVHLLRRGKKEGELAFKNYNLKRNQLVKKYGWGIHIDEQGKLALVGCETEKYERLARRAQERGRSVYAFRGLRGLE